MAPSFFIQMMVMDKLVSLPLRLANMNNYNSNNNSFYIITWMFCVWIGNIICSYLGDKTTITASRRFQSERKNN